MRAIISNNCWGAGAYQATGTPYNTPTVGLFFRPDDYIKFLGNLRALAASTMEFIPVSRYGFKDHPIGVIGDGIEIQFLHYKSQEEARAKWQRRFERLPPSDDDLIVKICDHAGLDQAQFDAFRDLPFRNKIAFLKRGGLRLGGEEWAVEWKTKNPAVPDGVALWRGMREDLASKMKAWIAPNPAQAAQG